MEILNETPILYKTSGAGQERQWQGKVILKDGFYYSVKVYGRRGGAQTEEWDAAEGKNIGRKNETSPYMQALKEMQADEMKKRKGGYSESGSAEGFLVKPMRLHTYRSKDGSGKADKFDWSNGAYAAEKLNGICYLVGAKQQWTRGLEAYELDFLRGAITTEPGGLGDKVLVGELYIPGEPSTTIAGALKGNKTEILQRARYGIFDCFTPGVPKAYEERREWLLSLRCSDPVHLHLGEKVENEAEALVVHQRFVEQGAEGTVLYQPDAIYRPDYRSYEVQRIKDEERDTVTIVGAKPDARGGALFIVSLIQYGETRTFDVTPDGSIEERQRIMANVEKYIGKSAVIKYYGLGAGDLPLFATLLINSIK